jgi:hypothetical protein
MHVADKVLCAVPEAHGIFAAVLNIPNNAEIIAVYVFGGFQDPFARVEIPVDLKQNAHAQPARFAADRADPRGDPGDLAVFMIRNEIVAENADVWDAARRRKPCRGDRFPDILIAFIRLVKGRGGTEAAERDPVFCRVPQRSRAVFRKQLFDGILPQAVFDPAYLYCLKAEFFRLPHGVFQRPIRAAQRGKRNFHICRAHPLKHN